MNETSHHSKANHKIWARSKRTVKVRIQKVVRVRSNIASIA